MRAFLSYSLSDSQQYVVSVLARLLEERGYALSSSYAVYGQELYQGAAMEINRSNLFIGVVTAQSREVNMVMEEYHYALDRGIPSLLLMDRWVGQEAGMGNNPNVVLFDAHNPKPAMDVVRSKLAKAHQSATPAQDNTAAWVLGGAALLALIALLSSEGKK